MSQDLSESNSEMLREAAKGEFNTDDQFEEMKKRAAIFENLADNPLKSEDEGRHE